jgi:protein-tyrosine phosphatase
VAADAAWLHERRITHILNVAREVPVFFPGRFCYLRLELVDSPDAAAQLRELLPRACDFIDAALARRGEGVLVHSALGKSRSVAVVLGYALLRAGWDLPRAAALLRDGHHGGIAVNWGFEAMLQRLQDERDGTAGQRRLRSPAGHA